MPDNTNLFDLAESGDLSGLLQGLEETRPDFEGERLRRDKQGREEIAQLLAEGRRDPRNTFQRVAPTVLNAIGAILNRTSGNRRDRREALTRFQNNQALLGEQQRGRQARRQEEFGQRARLVQSGLESEAAVTAAKATRRQGRRKELVGTAVRAKESKAADEKATRDRERDTEKKRLLAKIDKFGVSSLRASERFFLNEENRNFELRSVEEIETANLIAAANEANDKFIKGKDDARNDPVLTEERFADLAKFDALSKEEKQVFLTEVSRRSRREIATRSDYAALLLDKQGLALSQGLPSAGPLIGRDFGDPDDSTPEPEVSTDILFPQTQSTGDIFRDIDIQEQLFQAGQRKKREAFGGFLRGIPQQVPPIPISSTRGR